MRVFAVVVLFLSAVPLFALDFGPERPVTAAVYDLAPKWRMWPRVALNDDGGLVLWSDMRNEFLGIYVARFDRDGKLLDPSGRRVAQEGEARDVIWTGTNWLAVWVDLQKASVLTSAIGRDGVPGPARAVLPTNFRAHVSVRLAWNGSSIALVTNVGTGAILGPDGSVRTTFEFAPAPEEVDHTAAIAAVGDNFLIATVLPAGVAVRRLSPSGNISAAELLPGSADALTVALGTDGSSFLAVYDTPPHVYAQQLDALGTPVRAAERVATLPIKAEPVFPAIAWGGSDYLLSLVQIESNERSQPVTMRLTREGAVAAAPSPVLNSMRTFFGRVDVGRRGDGSGVVVSVSEQYVLEAAFFDGAAVAPRTMRPLSFSAPSQRPVRMAGEGNTLITAWIELTAHGEAVRLGHGVSGISTVVSQAKSAELKDVAIDGSTVWVVWLESPGNRPPVLLARPYTTSLEPLGAAPVTLPSLVTPRAVRAAAGGGALLVSWPTYHATPGVSGRLVRVDGTVRTVDIRRPRVASLTAPAWNGSEFVLVWTEATADPGGHNRDIMPHSILAARIGTNGALRDASPLVISDAPSVLPRALESASFAGSVVVAWQEVILTPLAPGGWDVLEDAKTTNFVRFDGQDRPAIRQLAGTESPRYLTAIAPAGERLAVLWATAGLEVGLLDRDFRVEETAIIPLYTISSDIAARGGQPVVGYSRLMEEPEYGNVYRVFLRTTGATRRRAVR